MAASGLLVCSSKVKVILKTIRFFILKRTIDLLSQIFSLQLRRWQINLLENKAFQFTFQIIYRMNRYINQKVNIII